MAVSDRPVVAIWLMAGALFLDLWDGFLARLLHQASTIGKQLDSLADMVSFGVFPGVLLYATMSIHGSWYAMLALVYPLAAALRLAKFNIDERQGLDFYGLPTPAAAIGLVGLYFLIEDVDLLQSTWPYFAIPILIALISALTLIDIPMVSPKPSRLSAKRTFYQIIIASVGLLILLFFRASGVSLVILWYVIFSIIVHIIKKKAS